MIIIPMANIFQGESKVARCVREWDRLLREREWVDTDVFASIFSYATISGDDMLGYEKAIKKAKAALTELFESIRSKDTPIAVEAVVNDIDTQVVAIVRKFTDTFATLAGQNEVKRQLRSILWIKYKIKDNEVFEKAYKYIEMYY
jgi:hypothetical protein